MISILLVDDQLAFLDMAKRFLEEWGDIQVATAASGEQAIGVLKERTFDVIISDYEMPGMNGLELLKTLRAQKNETPVIIYASQGREDVTIGAIRSGAEFVLHKSSNVEAQFSELKSIVKEIVRRRNAENARQRRDKDFQAIVSKNVDAMVVLDRDGVIQYVNPAATKLFNLAEAELTGRVIGFPIVLQEPVDMYILRQYREFVAVEMRMVEVEWGEQLSYLISFRDVTGHIRYEEELSKARDELELRVQERTDELLKANEQLKVEIEAKYTVEQELRIEIEERITTEQELRNEIEHREEIEKALEAAKGQAELYLDLMGHDINNLNQIGIGYLELALQAESLEDAKSLIEKPLDVMKSASEIISNVRKIKLVTEDKSKTIYEDQVVNLCDVLSELKSRYTNVSGRNIVINLAAPRLCFVRANELLKDVFSNLIDNAIKHSDPNKPLVISIKLERRKEKERSYYICAVEDNGPGIPDWIKDKVFLRFQRGTTKAHGKGLGLYLVRRLIHDYNGSIWVEDRVRGDHAQGTKFTIMLPAVD